MKVGAGETVRKARMSERKKHIAQGVQRCLQCNEIKPIESYHINRANPYGRQYRCRECMQRSGGPKATRVAEREALAAQGAKRCPKCGEVKPWGSFGTCKTTKDGVQVYCRVCKSTDGGAWSAQMRENSTLVSMGLKRCSKCKEVKALELFPRYKHGGGGRGHKCSQCNKSEARYRKTGISDAVRTALLNAQGGCCAICRERFDARKTSGARSVNGDHCHDTGAPRGLLCGPCNHAEGLIKRSGLTPAEFGLRLQKYIENPPAAVVLAGLELAG